MIPDAITQQDILIREGLFSLFLHWFSGRFSEAVEANCLLYGIELLTIPHVGPSTTFRAEYFTVHRMESSRVHPHLDMNDSTSKLIEIFCWFQKGTVGISGTDTFRKAEIMPGWEGGHRKPVCFIDRENASDVRHWSQTKKRVTHEAFLGGLSLVE